VAGGDRWLKYAGRFTLELERAREAANSAGALTDEDDLGGSGAARDVDMTAVATVVVSAVLLAHPPSFDHDTNRR
jgi:hypothetical protein